ncbi:TraR/DksA family transcriptional regulator [Halodesulfovibrio sp.]|uniref:TraR/DksA family transcriptional regulator n=1 Tax=Halodesulfovibrio sp. TaxID=1912772 RepID=UPI0025BD5ECC|nr:TraR/DksA family transcriptional regulator [Halodesulfovibrio sp.]
MQEIQKEVLVQKMHEEVGRLKLEVDRLKEITKPVAPDDAIGRLSRMDNIVNNSVNIAALSKAESRLAGLEYVLRNIDDPEFGYCMECGAPIPHARLMAMPGATLCVKCAE